MKLNLVGIDLSKSVFQLSITDPMHRIVSRKRLSRTQFRRWLVISEPAHLVMEACGTSHYWGRTAVAAGHQVSLLHPKYVTPYVRRNKTDAADADALIRAGQDRDLIPVPIKSEGHQALQSIHRIREQWKTSRIARTNEARGLLAEFGLVLPKQVSGAKLREAAEQTPLLLQPTLNVLIDEIDNLKARLQQLDRVLENVAASDPDCHTLMHVAGIGVITATAAVARVPNIHAFPRGKSFASWLGITCRESSSGTTRRLGSITKKGDCYLRTLLVHGARSALLAAKRKDKSKRTLTALERWAVKTEQRIGHNKATVALANKMARIMWAVWTRKALFNGDDALRFAA
jgi:transposase